jgi:glutathione S-transferase
MNKELTFHHHPISGHCHRVELMLSLLELPHRKVLVDLLQGEQKRPEFVRKSPLAQVPLLEDGDLALPDSNAILFYLARRYAPDGPWIPRDPMQAAQMQRWLSIAAGPVVTGPARARLIALFGQAVDPEPARAIARGLFAHMNEHLATRTSLVDGEMTLADVAMYAYCAHAPEGGVSLTPYPNVRRWIERVQAMPRFVPMVSTSTPELAQAS